MRRARKLEPASARAAYLYLSATREAARSGERAAALEALLTAVTAGVTGADDFAGLPIDLLDDASVDAPLFVPAAYVAGFRLLAQARYPEALASLRAAAAADPLVTSAARPTALNPADERARIAKADALVASGDRAAARASLLDTVRRFPDSGQAHWRLGRLAEDDADQAAALRSYEAASRCAPVAGASIVLRGDRAIAAHRARPRRRRARLRAPRRRWRRGPRRHISTSAPCIRRRTGSRTRSPSTWRRRWSTPPARVRGRRPASCAPTWATTRAPLRLLRRAVQLDANNGEARYALGRALLRVGRADESRQELAAFERIQKAAMEAQRRQLRGEFARAGVGAA